MTKVKEQQQTHFLDRFRTSSSRSKIEISLSARDKLLAMKRAEREKQLEAVEKTQSRARPKSARAARSIMSGKPAAADEKIDPQTLKARKALAEKLKAEVIGN